MLQQGFYKLKNPWLLQKYLAGCGKGSGIVYTMYMPIVVIHLQFLVKNVTAVQCNTTIIVYSYSHIHYH